MISKKLLSEVLGCKISKTMDEQGITSVAGIDDAEDGTYLIFRWQGGESSSDRYINIYELAHKCKEWAYDKHNETVNSFRSSSAQGWCAFAMDIPQVAETEPEAIFKACQWILDSKDKQ